MYFLRLVLETPCETAVTHGSTGCENETHYNGRKKSMGQFLSLLQEDLESGSKRMGTEQVGQVFRVVICIRLYCKKKLRMHDMFLWGFMKNRWSVGYIIG